MTKEKLSHNRWPSMFFLSDGGLVVLFESKASRVIKLASNIVIFYYVWFQRQLSHIL